MELVQAVVADAAATKILKSRLIMGDDDDEGDDDGGGGCAVYATDVYVVDS